MLVFSHYNFWNTHCIYCYSWVIQMVFVVSVMLGKPFQGPENKISLPNLGHSSGRIIFPVALRYDIWNSWISTLMTFLLFQEKKIVKNCHIWDKIQQLSSMMPLTALYREILLSCTQSSPFHELSLALSSDVEVNGIVHFLNSNYIQFESKAIPNIWKVFLFLFLFVLFCFFTVCVCVRACAHACTCLCSSSGETNRTN